MNARTPPRTRITSALAGEVGAKRREGGQLQLLAQDATALPNAPPQGGREPAAASGGSSVQIALGPPTRRRLAGFARTLRDNGFKIGLAETGDALAILSAPVAGKPASLKPALRALFCATRSDWQSFDEIFDAYWLNRGLRQARTLTGSPFAQRAPTRTLKDVGPRGGNPGLPDHVERRNEEGDVAGDGRGKREGASRHENLASTDLRHIVDPADIAETHELATRLARVMRARLIRRERVRRRGRRLDMRRTIHRNISHGGTLLDLAWRRRKFKPLRLVFLLDASGSMSLYTAFFVRFLHGVVDAFRNRKPSCSTLGSRMFRPRCATATSRARSTSSR